jgi:hypothetical protein
MKNKPTFAAVVKQLSKFFSGDGISASAVGGGLSFKGIKWSETDLGYLPAEFWPTLLLDATPELLRVAGLPATASRLNLHHSPFGFDEARLVRALLEPPRPDKPDFATHLSSEADSPPKMMAAEESATPMPRGRPNRDGQSTAAPRTVWAVQPHVGLV